MSDKTYFATDLAEHWKTSARTLNKELVKRGIAETDATGMLVPVAEFRSYGGPQTDSIQRSGGKRREFTVWKWDEFGKDLIFTRLRNWKPKRK